MNLTKLSTGILCLSLSVLLLAACSKPAEKPEGQADKGMAAPGQTGGMAAPDMAPAADPMAEAPKGPPAPQPALAVAALAVEKSLTASRDEIRALAWRPDGTRLVSLSSDHLLRFWDTVELKQKATMKFHEEPVASVAYSHDGEYIASGDAGGNVRTWIGGTGWKVQTFVPFPGAVAGLGFTEDGKVVCVSTAGAVSLRKPYTGKEVKVAALQLQGEALDRAVVSRDGKLVAGVVGGKAVGVWEVTSGAERHRFAGYSTADTLTLAWSADGKRLAIGFKLGKVRVHTLGETGPVLAFGPGGEKHVLALAFSPEGALLAWGLPDRTLQVHGFASGKVERTLSDHPGKVTALAFSPDGKRLASGDGNGVIKLWK